MVYIKSTVIWNYNVVGTKVVGPELLNLIQAKEILAQLYGLYTRSKSKKCVPIRRFHSTIFTTYNYTSFYKICGQVRGYQKRNTNAFDYTAEESIDVAYVDGVFITLGDPRKHVWSYAISLSITNNDHDLYCLCSAC